MPGCWQGNHKVSYAEELGHRPVRTSCIILGWKYGDLLDLYLSEIFIDTYIFIDI
jgi:hypothetical protein